jgi:hypothetical protein
VAVEDADRVALRRVTRRVGIAEYPAPWVDHVDSRPDRRRDARVVVSLDECQWDAFRDRRDERLEFGLLVAVRRADAVDEVAEDDDTVWRRLCDEPQESVATLVGPIGEFDAAFVPEAGLDAGVDVGDEQGSFCTEVGDRGRLADDGFDPRHQMALSTPSPGS